MEKPNGFHQIETSPERTMLTYLSLTEISDMEREIADITQAYLTVANERKAQY